MKNFFFLLFTFSLLIGCQQKNDLGKLYVLETIQNNTLEQFSYGEMRLSEMEEMIEDRTNHELLTKNLNHLNKALIKIDSLTGIQISKINSMKMEIFKSFDENISIKNKNSILHYDYKKEKTSRPIFYDFTNVKYVGKSELFSSKNKELIINKIRQYRREVCDIVVSSMNFENINEQYYFIDPQINNFKNNKDFYKQYDQKIKKSNIPLDNFEGIKKIYGLISKTDQQWNLILNESDSWIDDLGILLSLESDLLKVRSMAFDQIIMRIGCRGNYNFSNILTIVDGPNAAIAGDTVELKVLMAAYNAYQAPNFEIFKGGKLVKVDKGIGYVQVVLPKTKEIEIKGNITITNKSGIPKTLHWKHEIKILKEKID